MSNRSRIVWTDATWNPIRAISREGSAGWHCEHVSEGCRHCYAEGMNSRFGTAIPYARQWRETARHVLNDKVLVQPMRWRNPRLIFVGSMTDVFGEWVTDEMLDRVFTVMALLPQHTFQVLTKRPERMFAAIKRIGRSIEILEAQARKMGWTLKWMDYGLVPFPLPNVWLGVSVEDQASADARIPHLINTPSVLHFLSAEPLLGPVNLGAASQRLGWVICGAESGPQARPMHLDWVRSLRDQCAASEVPFFFKQAVVDGRKVSLPLLDGRRWNEVPEMKR